MQTNILYNTDNYDVKWTDSECLLEDGTTYGRGYKIVNRSTGIIEATSMALPNAIWAAQSMTKMLDDLLAADPAEQLDLLAGDGDVTIN